MAGVMMTDEILNEKFNNLIQQTIQEENESAKSPNSSQDNNAFVKKG